MGREAHRTLRGVAGLANFLNRHHAVVLRYFAAPCLHLQIKQLLVLSVVQRLLLAIDDPWFNSVLARGRSGACRLSNFFEGAFLLGG